MHADAVAAWAQWATVGIAGLATCFAYRQVLEARATRERVAAPDVVAYIDQNPKNWQWFDLVIKNFGQTPAYNVRVKNLLPLPIRPYPDPQTGKMVTHLAIPDSIAVLAPGQEWRTLWDTAIDREQRQDERTQFVGKVEFDEKMISKKPPHENPISLDTKMFLKTMRFAEDNIPKTIADNIEAVASILESYKDIHGGVWVYTVPGDQERQYLDEGAAHRAVQLKAARDHINRGLYGGSAGQTGPPGAAGQ
jgi:hypothetical protein